MPIAGDELRHELASWLQAGFAWDYFLTITFRWWARPDQSFQHFEYVHRALARYHPGHLFLGAELHSKGDLHLHGLYQCQSPTFPGQVSNPAPDVLWTRLFERFGRAKVERIHSQEAVSKYCTKYVVKELTDYNIW